MKKFQVANLILNNADNPRTENETHPEKKSLKLALSVWMQDQAHQAFRRGAQD
jgi:hypothetical protein